MRAFPWPRERPLLLSTVSSMISLQLTSVKFPVSSIVLPPLLLSTGFTEA